MTTLATSQSEAQSPVQTSSLFKAALAGGAIAALANSVVYGVGRLAGVDFMGQFDPSAPAQALNPIQPAIASIVPSVVAALVMLGFVKLLKRPAVPFIVLAVVFTLVSLGGPMSIVGASMGTKVALALMHFVAAAPITALLVRAVSRR